MGSPGGRGRGALALIILAVAAGLRFWALGQGLPHPSARPDEREVLQYTTGFAAGDPNPRWFIYPGLYLYLVWAWGELWLGVRRLGTATPAYAAAVTDALPLLLRAGRALSAAAGTATVGVLYVLGRRLGGTALGAVAALLLATNPLHVRDSHALKPDTLLALGILASLWLLAAYQESPDRRRATAAGVAIGLTTGMKYNGILLLLPAYLADVLARPGRLVPSRHLVRLAVVAVAVFLATNPFLVLDFARTRATFGFAMLAEYVTRPDARPAPGAGWLETMLTFVRTRAFGYHLAVSLRRGCGLGVALATPVALALAMRPPRRPLLVLAAAFTLLYYLVIGASPVHLSRYLMPLVPLLGLLVAHLVVTTARVADRPSARAAITAGLTFVLVAGPLAASVAQDRIAARTDTRIQALRWMDEHLPPGAVVAVLGSGLFTYADPVLPPGARRLPSTVHAGDFAHAGVSHVVTHEHVLPFSHPDPAEMRQLAPHLRLLAEFSPWPDGPAGHFETEDAYYIPLWGFRGVTRPGPVVRIYAYVP